MTHTPKISIVTPSYNQGQFLEATIRSVIDQQYPNLEYIIIDGGSSDNSLDIIHQYEEHLTYWVSEPDEGMYDAINKGFALSSGEIMAWLNSDDMYTQWAFRTVSEIFTALDVDWITTCFPLSWGVHGQPFCSLVHGYSRNGFFNGENLFIKGGFSSKFIQQESTFWRRSLWDRAGGYLDTTYSMAADFELWARFFRYADLIGVRAPLGGFRVHSSQQTAIARDVYLEQAREALRSHGGVPSTRLGAFIRRFSVKYVPHSFGRFVVPSLGMLYPATNCRYEPRSQQWLLEKVFV